MVAYHHACSRRLSTIGMSMTSGGMGKNELSMKDTSASAHGALLLAAMRIIQS
jgi:Ca2+/H+ antiporter